MAQGTLSPTPWFTGFLNTGFINAGGLLFTYAAGTTTKQNTYTDVALTVPNANPIVLDSAGRATIFLTPGQSYKFVMSPPGDTDPPSNPIRTQDNISASPITAGGIDVLATAGVNITIGQAVYLSDGSGGLNAGQWYLADSTNNYSSSTAPYIGIASSTFTVGNVGVVRVDGQYSGLAGLTAGVTYYISTAGTLTSSAPGNARKILVADSTISGLLMQDPQVAIVAATDTQTFVVNGTWTKPANPLWVKVICYGGGAGGAAGQTTAGAGAVAGGGGGGGGGARVEKLFQPSDLTATVAVTVGTGGTGGASNSANGVIGGNATFGAYLIAYGGYYGVAATAGNGGPGGTGGGSASVGGSPSFSVNVVGGAPGGGTSATVNPVSADGGGGTTAGGNVGGSAVNGGGAGAYANASGGAGSAGGGSMFGGGGGGGGGGVTAANANGAGGAGGAVSPTGGFTTGGGGTGGLVGVVFNTNQNGAAGSAIFGGAGGGGGGSRRDGTAAAAGGNGGIPAGGGGGGGGGQNSSAFGAGGNGAVGAVYVITGLGVSQ